MPHLPNETLLHIFSYLRISLTPETFEYGRDLPAKNLYTLTSLCRASKRFLSLTQPILYHTIPRQDTVARTHFLQTLSRCPHLAEMVQEIDLEITEVSTLILQESFEAARCRLNISSDLENEFWDALSADDPDAEVVLILSLLPNLRLLELTCQYVKGDSIVQLLSDVAGSRVNTPEKHSGQVSSPLSQLQEVRLRHWDTEYATSIFTFDDFLLQTVQTFRGWSISWEVFPRLFEPPQAQLNLKHIYLTSALCNAEGLNNLLSRCPDLQTLWIEWGSATVGGDSELDFYQIGVALRNHAHNLEELVLDCREDLSYEYRDHTGRIGSLRELSCLKMIAIHQDILVGDQDEEYDDSYEESYEADYPSPLTLDKVLPSSLERLYLLSCDDLEDSEDLHEEIYGLIGDGRMQNLREININRIWPFFNDIEGFGWTAQERVYTTLVKQENQDKYLLGALPSNQSLRADWLVLRAT
ncbi:hypothetical protein F4776DRAFT_644773 [Hypoxylon sp. NC0597]|nr:hypothetical protein F4776DRAFT_644773 [Hypoxylon sp. NC0597]